MGRSRIQFSVALLAALVVCCLVVSTAEARWHWTQRQAFDANLVCQDGAIVSVGAEAQSEAQLTLYFQTASGTFAYITIPMPIQPVVRYAPPDDAYSPFDPNGMNMGYYRTLRVTWNALLPIGSIMYVSAYNHLSQLVQEQYLVMNCQIKPTLYANASVTWRNLSNGVIARSFHNGATTLGIGLIGASQDPSWQIVGSGDYNGDFQRDLFWHHTPDDKTALFLLNGITLAGGGSGWLIDPAIRIVGNHDYNGDGLDDMLARNTRTGQLYVTYLTTDNTIVTPTVFDNEPDLNWFVAGSGDFDGNGSDDVLWRNRRTGAYKALFYCPLTGAKPTVSIAVSSLLSEQVVGVADFNGDALDDILLLNTQTNNFRFVFSVPTQRDAICGATSLMSKPLIMPMAAIGQGVGVAATARRVVSTDDFNGDGRADLLWHDEQTDLYNLWLLNGVNILQQSIIAPPERTGWQAVDTTDTAADRDAVDIFLSLMMR